MVVSIRRWRWKLFQKYGSFKVQEKVNVTERLICDLASFLPEWGALFLGRHVPG